MNRVTANLIPSFAGSVMASVSGGGLLIILLIGIMSVVWAVAIYLFSRDKR